MQGAEFVARNHTLKTLISVAYNLSPHAITGGPAWVDSEHYDIFAKPSGSPRPSFEEQAAMLRVLLSERFHLTFHRESKVLPIFTLSVAKGGHKLAEGTVLPEGRQPLAIAIGAHGVTFPGKDASSAEFAAVLQRAALDRPLVDKTGLTGRYDFSLSWTPDESQFGGMAPRDSAESTEPDLYTAIQQQMGLKLEATRGPASVLVIDEAERPSDN